jgi:hypothetical protein
MEMFVNSSFPIMTDTNFSFYSSCFKLYNHYTDYSMGHKNRYLKVRVHLWVFRCKVKKMRQHWHQSKATITERRAIFMPWFMHLQFEWLTNICIFILRSISYSCTTVWHISDSFYEVAKLWKVHQSASQITAVNQESDKLMTLLYHLLQQIVINLQPP